MNGLHWALMAAAVWGMAPLLEKAGLNGISPMTGLFYRCLGVLIGLILLVLFWVKPADIRSVPARSILCLILAGFLASIVGQMFFYSALKQGEVSRLAPVGGSYPLFAFILGVLILGEAVTPLKVVGSLLIVGGVWLLKIG